MRPYTRSEIEFVWKPSWGRIPDDFKVMTDRVVARSRKAVTYTLMPVLVGKQRKWSKTKTICAESESPR